MRLPDGNNSTAHLSAPYNGLIRQHDSLLAWRPSRPSALLRKFSTRYVSPAPAPQQLGLHGQTYPLFIGESKTLPFELLLENTVLFYKIVDDRLLVPTEPSGQGDYEEVEGL
jgi:hypothetical protein